MTGVSRARARWPFPLVALFLAGCLSALAQAQDQSALATLDLEQLTQVKVYAASRRAQSTQDAPASITLISAEEIHAHGWRTLAAILRNVPGFFVTSDRDYSSLGVRGFARPGDLNTRVLLLIDGHRLNDNVYEQAMIGTEFPMDVDMISRIEIVRGPVSSLYGSNALFGAINVITKRGRDIGGPQVAASAGSFNTYQGRATYGKQFANLEFLASGTLYRSDGHNALFYPEFDTPATNFGIASHADGGWVNSALIAATYRDITFHALYGSREKTIPTGAYGTIFNNSGTRTIDTHGYVDLRFDHLYSGSWEVMLRGYYDDYIYHGTYEYPSQSDPTQVSPELDSGNGEWAGGEAQVTKQLGASSHIVAGTELRDNFRQDQLTYDLNPYSLQLDDRQRSYVVAAYLQLETPLAPRLDLNAGLRYDYYSSLTGSVDPRIALIYRPKPGTALKAIYGEAFRAPNDYELFYAVPPNVANPALKPERIQTTEGIWEQHLSDAVVLSTSVFHSNVAGLITQTGDAQTNLQYANLNTVHSTGAELELSGRFATGLTGRASYSFQETRDVNSGQLLNDSPRTLGSLSLSYLFKPMGLTSSFDAQYRSRIQTITPATVSPYTIVNATLLERTLGKSFDLALSAYNLLDKQYADPGSGSTVQTTIPQDGRSLRVQMTWRLPE